MTRRLTALLGLVILIALVAGLVWGVWRHSHSGRFEEEPAVVVLESLDQLAAFPNVTHDTNSG